MNKKKKIIIIICIAIIIICACAAAVYYFFFQSDDNPPTLEETVNNRISAYETDLLDSFASMTNQAAVTRYLVNWAENKGIDVTTDDAGNVIYSIKASEGFESQPPSVVLCGYDYTSMESYKNSIASALTIAKNDMPHSEYKVIFISEENGNENGAETLSKKIFDSDTKVFYLEDTSSSRIALSTGGLNEYQLSKDLTYTSTNYDVAYKISISGIPQLKFTSINTSAPNPIKTLGELLANFKSTSILFELASFSGGQSSNMIPQDASITIVVNSDQAQKLESNLDRAIEKFYDKYSNDYPDLSYTYEVVDTPSRVISTENSESIVSLLYTAISGVHYKDDNGEIASIANIGYISTENETLNIEVAASSYSDELIEEITTAYQTISALTDVTYTLAEEMTPFHASEAGEALAEEFLQSYSDYQSTNLSNINIAEWTPASIINSKNSDMPVIVFGVTEKTMDNFAGGLITFFNASVDQAEAQ